MERRRRGHWRDAGGHEELSAHRAACVCKRAGQVRFSEKNKQETLSAVPKVSDVDGVFGYMRKNAILEIVHWAEIYAIFLYRRISSRHSSPPFFGQIRAKHQPMRAQKFCFAHGVFVRAAHGLFKPRHVAHQQDLNQRPADLRREGFDKKALFRERVQPSIRRARR